MFVASYKHNQFVSVARGLVSRFIAIAIILSFFAMFIPIASASRALAGVMACCIGKGASYCHARLAHKPSPPPKPEPMCGLTSQSLDAITIIAEPSTQSHDSRHNAESPVGAESQAGVETKADAESNGSVESASLSRPCPM